MNSNFFPIILSIALMSSTNALAQLKVSVLKSPQPAIVDGQTHLFYELVLENTGDQDATIRQVSVDGGSLGQGSLDSAHLLPRFQILSLIDFDTIKDWLNYPKPSSTSVLAVVIPPGRSGLIYLQLDGPTRTAVPTTIHHEIDFSTGLTSQAFNVNVDVRVDSTEPLILHSPFHEGQWMGLNPPWDGSAHRRSVQKFRGHYFIGQRFAIDWMRVGSDGYVVKPNEPVNQNTSYYGYGTPVYAVAAAKVVQVTDGLKENTPGEPKPAIVINEESVGGNAVILDIGNGHYAFYAHLQPGQILVKVGDQVKEGQLIGLLGNSGNSSGPHLHFHVCDEPSELSCQGIPYVFDSFTHQTIRVDGKDVADMHVTTTSGKTTAQNELVWINQLIEFPLR